MTSNPNYARELANLGTMRLLEKRFPAAEGCLRRAYNIDQQITYALNLSSTVLRLGKAEEAVHLAETVLEAHPEIALAWSALGLAQLALGEYEKSRDSFGMAVYFDPNSADHHMDYSAALMLLGDWDNGWREYESRTSLINQRLSLPAWDGEVDKHVLVSSEQGAGDVIQFCRYIPLLSERVEKLTFSVPPSMYSLLQGFSQFGEVVTAGTMRNQPDEEILLQSLPCYFDTTPGNVPPTYPEWFATGMIPPPGPADDFKVGICWSGNPNHPRDIFRSIPFEEFLPLAFDPENHLFSFQSGPRAADITQAGAQSIVSDLSGMIECKWSAAASFLKQMDAVVSCDTGIAHMAASLGIPTVLLTSAIPDWRWLVKGYNMTPWYQSMHIVRQKKLFDWKTPIEEALAVLRDIRAKK